MTARNPTPSPQPTTVHYNDWPRATSCTAETFVPTLPLSVVVPYFEAPETLALVLAALEGQTYPRDLFEVVIVDDGSMPSLQRPSNTPLDVTVVHQEDRGFGLARARNNGARMAKYEILVFLDDDMVAEAGLLAAHARWHHGISDALTLGFYATVSMNRIDPATIRGRAGALKDLLADRSYEPPWIERYMARTANLTTKDDDLFGLVSGGNLGVSKTFYETVGGYDESFTRYGAEDTELAYRAYNQGALLVPVRDALAWQCDVEGKDSTAKRLSNQAQRAKVSNLIPHPEFRESSPGRMFAVPRHVVTIEVDDEPLHQVFRTAEEILSGDEFDLVVRINVSRVRRADEVAWLDDYFGPDPRVRVAPPVDALSEFPASPLQVTLQPTSRPIAALVRDLRTKLGVAVTATGLLRDGTSTAIHRAWAQHRAERTGKATADFGDVLTVRVEMPAMWLGPILGRAELGWLRLVRRIRRQNDRLIAEAKHIGDVQMAVAFLKWLGGRLWAHALWWRAPRRSNAPPTSLGTPRPGTAALMLGVDIVTLGARAQAVFQAGPQTADQLRDQHVDVVLADTDHDINDVTGVPTVVLASNPSLAVPAFIPTEHNPVGWIRDVEDYVLALGPRYLLPSGIKSHRTAQATDQNTLRRCHHVEDVAEFHSGPVERAATLVRLVAEGVPVHLADRQPELRRLLGNQLHDLMAVDQTGASISARELTSINMRRIALRDHSVQSRARQVCELALTDPPRLPTVSILLATSRPGFLGHAMANIARQNYPRVELVLALHGPGFDDSVVTREVELLDRPVTIIRLGLEYTLGSVLNAATEAASGIFVTKMDDDDVYGRDHLWDLVLAHGYSAAQLVGKGAETVYLGPPDQTVERSRTEAETYSRAIAGGTLFIGRQDLHSFGGWRRRRLSEGPGRIDRPFDYTLISDVLQGGGTVYRTHGAGYVLIRHGRRHAWAAEDGYFLTRAHAIHPGWQPGVAGIVDVPRPTFAA